MKIGVIGAGAWGKNHVRVLSELVGPESVVVADLNKKERRSIQEKYGIKTTENYLDLLSDNKVEAVNICTPSQSHYKICKESLLAGKDVLCEKPLALNSSSCKDLVEISEKEDKVLFVGHIFRYDEVALKLKQIIKSGTLGTLFFIQSERLGLRTPRSDCGVIFDFAVHDVDLLSFFNDVDYPEEVLAVAVSCLQYGRDDFSTLVLKFNSNVFGHVVVSWLTPNKIRTYTVVGKQKSVVADFVKSNICIYDKAIIPIYDNYKGFKLIANEGATHCIQVSSEEPLKTEMKHFLDCVKYRKKPITDGIVGLRAVQVLEAAYESARKGRWVKMKNFMNRKKLTSPK